MSGLVSMSFSKETKKELCTAPVTRAEDGEALIYGMLLFSKVFSPSAISFTTESREAAQLYSEKVSSDMSVIADISVTLTRKGSEGKSWCLSIPDSGDCKKIFDHFGHDPMSPSLRINRSNIDEDGTIPYFLRGAFLVCGNVSDPVKDYHLEFAVPHMNLAKDLARIISETELLGTPKTVRRKGSYVVYIKESDAIADLLTYIGAPMSALEIMQQKIYKSVRNKVNRQINSETANSNKTALASAKQIAAIEKISRECGLDSLTPDLRELAQIRLDNPEYNLRELGEALSTPISRSGVNHRLARIMKIADKI